MQKMKNINKSLSLFLFVTVLCICGSSAVLAQSVGGASVQTNSATNISNYQATLNGYFSLPYINGSNYVYFQWGTTTGYGSQTTSQYLNNSGSFIQIATGLSYNTTYHFRAVAQGSFGTIYGQDMTFYTGGQSNNGTITANAGPDLYLTSSQTSILQGSGYTPNGYSLNYSWSCTGGSLSNYNIAQPVYTAPYAINGNNQTTYTCTLTVTDGYGNSNSDSMVVYVNYNNGNNYGNVFVQTTNATGVSNYQATLNGILSGNNISPTNYVYFQWGTTTNYNNQTGQQNIGYSGTFMQNITYLIPNTTYHYRAIAYGSNGTVYGQDMTFNTSSSGYYNYNNNGNSNGSLLMTKQVIDLSSGNLNWSTSVNASPSDVLDFNITLQAYNQNVQNVVVRDILPANLIYKGNLKVNANYNYGGDITSGVNIGTVYAGQAVDISYQVQVAPLSSFSYGTTTLTNSATATSSTSGTQTTNATVIVNKTLVYGASTVSTGLTNNFFTDSFFLPLLLIVAGVWIYFSGNIYVFADKLKLKMKSKN